MGDTDDPAKPNLGIWESLLERQTTLFRDTIARNQILEQKVTELQTEVSVWKLAHNTANAENEILKKSVQRLERSIGSIKDENPLILCLIDGDGNIFSSELITQGHSGGRLAAQLLTQGLTQHMASMETDGDAPLGRGEIWLTIYCNKKGLTEALTSTNVCTAEQFEQFVMGFNQAAPLFSIVDVGVGKEAADSKIKECLRVFTRFPQTSRVFFGGAHDNGYTTTLNYLQNEGLFNKLVILRGYKDLAPELRSLNLPYLDIEGLFLQEKLNTRAFYKKGSAANNSNKPNAATSNTVPQAQNTETSRPKGANSNQPSSSGKAAQPRRLAPNLPLSKQRPAPCNFYYLTGSCKWSGQCAYAHDYQLTAAQVQDLRRSAKNWPCPHVNAGHPCPYVNSGGCCMAHKCPKGAKCKFVALGKCKFKAKGMHSGKTGDGSPDDTSGGATSPSPSTHMSISPAASPYSDAADLPAMPGIGFKARRPFS